MTRLTGIMPFQTIMTKVFMYWFGFYNLLTVVNRNWPLYREDAAVQGNYPSREENNKKCAKKSFTRLQNERNANLYPFLDLEGIIRLKTKVVERTDVGDLGIPNVLPSSHPTVQMLVMSTHVKSRHVGVQGLLSLLREKFWILKGRKSNRAILSTCNVCRRYEAKHITASTPASSAPRVWDAAVFETTDVDMAGPFFWGDGRKMWVMSAHLCGILCGSLGIGLVIVC